MPWVWSSLRHVLQLVLVQVCWPLVQRGRVPQLGWVRQLVQAWLQHHPPTVWTLAKRTLAVLACLA